MDPLPLEPAFSKTAPQPQPAITPGAQNPSSASNSRRNSKEDAITSGVAGGTIMFRRNSKEDPGLSNPSPRRNSKEEIIASMVIPPRRNSGSGPDSGNVSASSSRRNSREDVVISAASSRRNSKEDNTLPVPSRRPSLKTKLAKFMKSQSEPVLKGLGLAGGAGFTFVPISDPYLPKRPAPQRVPFGKIKSTSWPAASTTSSEFAPVDLSDFPESKSMLELHSALAVDNNAGSTTLLEEETAEGSGSGYVTTHHGYTHALPLKMRAKAKSWHVECDSFDLTDMIDDPVVQQQPPFQDEGSRRPSIEKPPPSSSSSSSTTTTTITTSSSLSSSSIAATTTATAAAPSSASSSSAAEASNNSSTSNNANSTTSTTPATPAQGSDAMATHLYLHQREVKRLTPIAEDAAETDLFTAPNPASILIASH